MSILYAQEPENQFVSGINGSQIGFKQEFNTYIWNYNLNTYKIVRNRWRFGFAEKFRSSLLNLSKDNDKWKDDQNLNVNLDYFLFPTLTIQSRLASVVFLDKQSGFNNDIRTHQGNVGIEYTPFANTRIFTQIGPKWDNRFSQNDQGYNYSFEITAKDFQWEKYENSLDFMLGKDQFSQRQNHDLNLLYNVSREFVPGTTDSLQVVTSSQRRDNYTSNTGDIESLRENIKGVNNVLLYTLSKNIDMRLKNGMYFKNVEILSSFQDVEQKRRKRNDQRFSHDLLLVLKQKKVKGQMQLSYWSQKQVYDIELEKSNLPFSQRTAFVTPNNESNRLMFVSGLSANITNNDSLYSYFSISKFQYDTPDTNNFDDRDELRINSRLIAFHKFSPALNFEVQASVNFYHMVYIFGERSADNNWNRIFLLRPIIHYYPVEQFKLKQSFEVLANYVDYDFEDKSVLTKSFVFRKFSVDDSLQYGITPRTTLLFDYRLQLEENGQLSWENWTEKVLLSRRNQWLHLFVNYQPYQYFRVAPGYSYYIREEWHHNTNQTGIEKKEKTGSYTSQGPVLRLYYVPSKKVKIIFDAIRYKVNPPDQGEYFINNIQLILNWTF
ncbi:hypothetical protein JXQ31_01950 [candidate division KSB1 bacterium]|nr:hypothetical protein [candidate division KSB1 bacterium]